MLAAGLFGLLITIAYAIHTTHLQVGSAFNQQLRAGIWITLASYAVLAVAGFIDVFYRTPQSRVAR
jgi:hypothetical protein